MLKKECLIEWDIKINDTIDYFDPELSYELTGYRPINNIKGLDFKPELFRKAAISKQTIGKYCIDPDDSRGSRIYWKEELRRIEEGHTIGKYTLTGNNYFYVNYYSLGSGIIKLNEKTKKEELVEGIPNIYISQYTYFHYLEMCELLSKDVVFLKARGIGASEMTASIVTNHYTYKGKSKSLLVASLEKYIGDLWDKVEVSLAYLNTETQGGFRRLRQKIDKRFSVRASLIRENEEVGHMASIEARTIDKPGKLRGGRTKYVAFEEAGSFPNLLKTWQVAEPLVKIEGRKFGTRFAFGTGGDEGKDLIGLDTLFHSPEEYNILPFRHTYNHKKEIQLTGFFMPCWINEYSLMDKRGYVNREEGEKHDFEAERKKLTNPTALSNRCSEYCWYPSEALSKKGDNRFNQDLLQDRYIAIKDLKEGPIIVEGDLHYEYDNGIISGVKWIPMVGGPIQRTSEIPILMDNNNKPFLHSRPLYIAGIDSIDKGKEDSVVGDRGSEFCIVVKKRIHGLGGNEYVCIYKERPNTVSEAWDKALKILMYYNCSANLEDTKTSIKGHFRKHKQLNRLIGKPRIAQSDITRYQTTNAIGTPASTKMILHALSLITDYVEYHSRNLHFLDMIQQLKDYSFDNKGKFDIIAAMGMAEIYDQEIEDYSPKTQETTFNWIPQRWYTDNDGNRRYGNENPKRELRSEIEGVKDYGFVFKQ